MSISRAEDPYALGRIKTPAGTRQPVVEFVDTWTPRTRG